MIVFDPLQSALSKLQCLPIVGPMAFSPVKALVSIAHIVSALSLGVIFGVGTTLLQGMGCHRLTELLGRASIGYFAESIKGFGSLFYACANIATLGGVGIFIESDLKACWIFS